MSQAERPVSPAPSDAARGSGAGGRLLRIGAYLGVLLIGVFALWHFSHPAPIRVVLRQDLDLKDGVLFVHGEPAPYRGLLVEDYAPEKRKVEIEIVAGRADGRSRGWFEDGTLEVEEHFVKGLSHGQRTRWHANGQRKSIETIVNGQLEGAYSEWHDNGQSAVVMNLKAGHPEGLAEAWYRSGILKSRTHFAEGKITGQEHFADTLAATPAPPSIP